MSNLVKNEMNKLYDKKDPWSYGKCNRHEILLGLIRQYGQSGGSLLEVGCAEGMFTGKVPLRYLKDYIGLELSGKAINVAKSRLPQLIFVKSSFEDFSVSKRFNMIVVSDVVPYFDSPVRDSHLKLLGLLYSGGILFMTTWMTAIKGTAMFPWIEFQDNIKVLFQGSALARSFEGYWYGSEYFVGMKL